MPDQSIGIVGELLQSADRRLPCGPLRRDETDLPQLIALASSNRLNPAFSGPNRLSICLCDCLAHCDTCVVIQLAKLGRFQVVGRLHHEALSIFRAVIIPTPKRQRK